MDKEKAVRRAKQLSKVVSEQMERFYKPLEEQAKWFNYELENGICSEESKSITKNDKELLKKECESIVNHLNKTISAMKAIKAMCE